MFYCREKERSKLDKRYNEDDFECIVIYGRRRVGKTALINEFCKDKPAVSALNSSSYTSVFGKGNRYYYYIFSKGGFTYWLRELGNKGEVKLLTLEDIYR